MLCLEYNPKDPHVLVGGCYNGQLALFDTRKGSQPLEVTPVETSHKDPVHKLIFPSSKTGGDLLFTIVRRLSGKICVFNNVIHTHTRTMCAPGTDVFSTSSDGQVLWWDIRKLGEPVETLPLEFAGYKQGETLGGIALEYDSTMVSSPTQQYSL